MAAPRADAVQDDGPTVALFVPGDGELVDPAPEETARRGVELSTSIDDRTIGVVGWSSAGLDALREAAGHPEVARLVLVAVPFPDDPFDVGPVAAKTLLLFGAKDPTTGSKHGRQWQRHLAGARLEMVPGGGHDLLTPMWRRILSHVAPGRTRRDR